MAKGTLLAHCLSCVRAFAARQQCPQHSCIARAPLWPHPASRWLLQTALQVAQGSHAGHCHERVAAPHSSCSGLCSAGAKGRPQCSCCVRCRQNQDLTRANAHLESHNVKVEQEKTVLQAQKDQLAQNLEAVMKDKLQPHKQVREVVCWCLTSNAQMSVGPPLSFSLRQQ